MTPPTRRRSARLASASVKISKTSMIPTLSSLAEQEETPQPKRARRAAVMDSPVSPSRNPQTPSGSSPAKPAKTEMHPSKAPRPVAPPSSGFRLGFTDIDTSRPADQPSIVQNTPSKSTAPSGDFTFRITRPSTDAGLGPEAQRMMAEIREEAQKIKAQLSAKRELERQEEDARKIAQPKSKAGRYSAAHMAEFKKMDSIEAHPSAFRAAPGRFTPVKAGNLKRTKSKANLDDPESSPAKPTPSTQRAVKRATASTEDPAPVVKRVKQHLHDDASTNRPVSRDESNIPRPTSRGNGLQQSRPMLMTPTKSSLARSATLKTPGGAAKSPLKLGFSGAKSAATITLVSNGKKTDKAQELISRTVSPTSRMEKIKNLFRGKPTSHIKSKDTIPRPVADPELKSPGIPRLHKGLPSIPTTPGSRLLKRVAFTPETKRATLSQNSPSPIKSSISKFTRKKISLDDEVKYPSLDSVLLEDNQTSAVKYPSLESSVESTEPSGEDESHKLPPTVPGTFTFRSDHTINFGATSPNGFGGSVGQVSLRHVRASIPTSGMPGSFPLSTGGQNKENKEPSQVLSGIPHGVRNKKRHRASWDEDEVERDAASRAKKARRDVPEGDALLAPRLVSEKKLGSPTKKPLSAPTPSPMKKRPTLSMARLNLLATPKNRK